MGEIRGTFRDKNNQAVVVIISCTRWNDTIRIGEGDPCDIYFHKDPVVIQTEMDETMDVIIMKSCTVKLYVKNYMGDRLFSGKSRDIMINVWKSGICLFAGFVEPNVYNQDYNHVYDQLTLTCTDALATLQYYPYNNIYTKQEYETAKNECGKITINGILSRVFAPIPQMDLANARNNIIYYDGSIRVSSSDGPAELFGKVTLYDLLWYGDEKDDMMNCDEVLEEVLKYFDLHIMQNGCNFYIFNWQSIKNRQTIDWYPILVGDSYQISQTKMVMRNGQAREALVSLNNNTVIPGNLLPTSYEDEIVYYDSAYINWEDATLPNQTKAKTGNYRLADLSDWDFLIKNKDSILKTSIYGDYDETSLRTAPAQCYENDQFKYPYYTVSQNEFLTTDQ